MKKIIVTFVTVAILAQNVHTVSLAKRATENEVDAICGSMDDNVIVQLTKVFGGLMDNIPLLGVFIEPWMIYVGNFMIITQNMANETMGMLLSEAAPCIISEENDFVCTGVAADDGYVAVVTKMIFLIPGFIVPGIYRDLTEYLLTLFLQPILVFILGGAFVYPEIK